MRSCSSPRYCKNDVFFIAGRLRRIRIPAHMICCHSHESLENHTPQMPCRNTTVDYVSFYGKVKTQL